MKQTFTVVKKEAVEPIANQVTVGGFFITLLHSATITHLMHLQTSSYSEHKALGNYYDEIVDLVDSLIESYQGKKDVIVEYPAMFDYEDVEALVYLRNLSDYVVTNRGIVGDDSELQNQIDTIQDLINSTVYKLRRLA